MIEKIKKYKFIVMGELFGLFIFLTVILPGVLHELVNHSEGFFEIWMDVGFGIFSFVMFSLLGISIGKLIENIRDDE